jgi:DNA polymerase III epsilon subunit family exonuclease
VREKPAVEYVALDLETTGLSPAADRIVELGAARLDPEGRERDSFDALIATDRVIGQGFEIHGIREEQLRDAPSEADVIDRLLRWLGPAGSLRLVAHKARVEASFLGAALRRAGRPDAVFLVIDTLDAARRFMPEAPRCTLASLAERLGLPADVPHRALADARRVAGLWRALLRRGLDPGDPTLRVYRAIDPAAAPWGLLPVGWEWLVAPLQDGRPLTISHLGGSKGPGPRTVTPREVVEAGGREYLVAFCHLDRKEKRFRLDRIAPLGTEAGTPDGLESPPARR